VNHEPILGGKGNPTEDNIDTINRIVNDSRRSSADVANRPATHAV